MESSPSSSVILAIVGKAINVKPLAVSIVKSNDGTGRKEAKKMLRDEDYSTFTRSQLKSIVRKFTVFSSLVGVSTVGQRLVYHMDGQQFKSEYFDAPIGNMRFPQKHHRTVYYRNHCSKPLFGLMGVKLKSTKRHEVDGFVQLLVGCGVSEALLILSSPEDNGENFSLAETNVVRMAQGQGVKIVETVRVVGTATETELRRVLETAVDSALGIPAPNPSLAPPPYEAANNS